jgi:hypothetical protein
MTLAVTHKNVEWLIERLYELRRPLESAGIQNPTVVLLTKTPEDRFLVEKMFYMYFTAKYGALYAQGIEHVATTKFMSGFSFPEFGCRIVLMDI